MDPGNKGGRSESFIGAWLESRGVRGDMRIHTKTGMLSRNPQISLGADGDPDLYQPAQVLKSLDESLTDCGPTTWISIMRTAIMNSSPSARSSKRSTAR